MSDWNMNGLGYEEEQLNDCLEAVWMALDEKRIVYEGHWS